MPLICAGVGIEHHHSVITDPIGDVDFIRGRIDSYPGGAVEPVLLSLPSVLPACPICNRNLPLRENLRT